jgi:mono/diheme cytochrome c family protein
MRHPDGVWAGYTYEWDDNETNAVRVIGGKTKLIDGQSWTYPSEGQCDSCHTVAAGFALGLESAQMNRDFTYVSTGRTANQLTTLDHIALFDAALPNVPDSQPRLTDPANAAASLDSRARAYLHTNCSQCHRPLGPAPSAMDLRYQASLAATNTCDLAPIHGDLGIANARLIAPGDPSRSILVNRMSRRDVHGMPPLASSLVDTAGANLLAGWISSLASCN